MHNMPISYEKIYSDIMNEIKSIRKREYEARIQAKRIIKKGANQRGFEHIINENACYFSDYRIAIYTCIMGDYDVLNEPFFVPDNCDFYVITDGNVDKESKWKKIEPYNDVVKDSWSASKINRYYKLHPFELFDDYRYSIYLDGSIKVFTDLTELINCISNYGMAFYSHPDRTCVYEEIKTCIKLKKDNKKMLERHGVYLRNKGIQEDYGLLAAGVIVRDHQSGICKKVMNDWWEEYLKYSKRDQISLIAALFDNSIKPDDVATLVGGVFSNCSLECSSHIK